jgi:hypothetical protein
VADKLLGYGLSLRLMQHHHHILCHGVSALPSSMVPSLSDNCDSELEKLGPKYRVALMSEYSSLGWHDLPRLTVV